MQILILGGTRFVGRHIVEAFLQAGHTVSLLTRGRAEVDFSAPVEQLVGNRDEGAAGLAALGSRQWDACVDVSGYQPRQVRASAEALRGRVGRYLFISTASVYAEQNRSPIRETDPLLPPYTGEHAEISFETYGALKVACEQVVQQAYGDRCTILRPQIVVGPYDYTPRYPYWPDRVARGGKLLAAGDGSDFIQVIDARDLANFAVRIVENQISGVFNVAGPRLTWAEFLGQLGAKEVHWVGVPELERAGIDLYEFPLFLPTDSAQEGLMNVDNSSALAAGLTLTDPAATARDTREWSRGAAPTYALTPEREAEIWQGVSTS